MKSLIYFCIFFLLVISPRVFAQCTSCDFTNPVLSGNYTIPANKTVCYTTNATLDGINFENGATLCVSPNVSLTIVNNVNTSGTIIINNYGTLNFNQSLNISANLILRNYNSGIFLAGSGNGNINFNGPQENQISNNGFIKASNVAFSQSSSKDTIQNIGNIELLGNLVTNGATFLRNTGSITFNSSFAIDLAAPNLLSKDNDLSLYINCGTITAFNHTNFGGGKIINTGTWYVSTLNFDHPSVVFENYGFLECQNTLNLNAQSALLYNEGIVKANMLQGSGNFIGPPVGSGKLGYIELKQRATFNNNQIGPNIDWTYSPGTTLNGDGRLPNPPGTNKPGAGENGTSVSTNRQWVFQNMNGSYLEVNTHSFDCRSQGNCAAPLVTTYPCFDQGGSLPDVCLQFQTKNSGLFSDPAIWESRSTIHAPWFKANNPPVPGNAVIIAHDVLLDIEFDIENCPLTLSNNTTSKLTIAPNKTLNFKGGTDGNAYLNHRPLVVQSTSVGTGAIGTMTTESKTIDDDNVTLERYIPGLKRRWNLLAIGVTSPTATIRDAWAGGSRTRVSNSSNSNAGLPLGNPPVAKPKNNPYPAPMDYLAGDGTIITGHNHSSAANANGEGYDWWPELIIPAGAIYWLNPSTPIKASSLATTPSSIRPYWPSPGSGGFGTKRGKGWLSNQGINTGFNGGSLINQPISASFAQKYPAFMLFTRGDRKVLENWFSPTTLRPVGQINKFEISIPVKPKNTQSLSPLGNPYPAPINFQSLLSANTAIIQPYFYMWDSHLPGNHGHGAWRTVFRPDPTGSPNTWVATIYGELPPNDDPLTSNPQYISSSQGFMVEGTVAGGNITFTEAMKVPVTEVEILPFDAATERQHGILFTNLQNRSSEGTGSTLDGVAIILSKNLSTNLTDESDVRKVYSFTGDQSISIKRGTDQFAVEGSADPETEASFPLEIIGLTQKPFRLQFFVEGLYKDGREAFLKDNFLGTLTPISTITQSVYDFEGTEEDSSLSPSRFEIIFKQSTVLPVNFTYMNAAENRGDVQVTWGVATEKDMNRYEIEHGINGRDFEKAIRVDALNLSPASYSWTHVHPAPGDHFYRVRAVNNDGKSLLTRVVKVTLGSDKPGFKIFPTVINRANNVTVQLNALEKGEYQLQVLDMNGRTIQSQMIKHNGGSASLILKLNPSLASGKYSIRLKGQKQNFVESILMN